MKIGCALLIFLPTAVLSQTPPEQKSAVVEGKVINSISGAAIRKAELSLTTDLMPEGFADMLPGSKPKEPKRSFSATSDAAGKFHFDHVAPGDYYFTVKHVGFVDLTYKPAGPIRTAEGMLRLKPGQELHDLELRLVPQGAVAGKVIDEDGDPVPDAMVVAESANYSSGRRTMQIRDSSTTNDRGEFRLGKLAPGRYYISLDVLSTNPTGEVPAPKDGLPETGYVATYFPKTTDWALAEPVDVKGGADVPGLAIQLQKSRVVRVKGKVVGGDGKPVRGAQVMLMSASRPGSMRMTMVNDAEGGFELANVPPGPYTAMIMQVQDQKMIQQPLLVPNEDLVDVKLGAMTEGSLGGRVIVTGEGKAAVKGLEISLISDEAAAVMPVSARVDESGTFVLKKVLATTYELNISDVPEGAYLKSVLWNGKEKLGAPFDFTGGVAGDLQVFLGTDGGTFDVRVSRDDKPVSDATVVLLRDDASQRNPETTRSGETDESGHLVLKDVPPGNYLAFAWEKVEEGDWFDPVFLKGASDNAVRVTVAPKDNLHLDLKAIPAGK
jgi:protocatechuate 3,4-dioxygenase beta subunit